MLFVDGVLVIVGDLLCVVMIVLEVLVEVGELLGIGVWRLSVLLWICEFVYGYIDIGNIVVIGGDCSVMVVVFDVFFGGIDDLVLVWCDVYGDLYIFDIFFFGVFFGMVLCVVFGDGELQFVLFFVFVFDWVVIVGMCVLDDLEVEQFQLLRNFMVVDFECLEVFFDVVWVIGVMCVWVYIDVDVLDFVEFVGVFFFVLFGFFFVVLSVVICVLCFEILFVGVIIVGFVFCLFVDVVDDLGVLL